MWHFWRMVFKWWEGRLGCLGWGAGGRGGAPRPSGDSTQTYAWLIAGSKCRAFSRRELWKLTEKLINCKVLIMYGYFLSFGHKLDHYLWHFHANCHYWRDGFFRWKQHSLFFFASSRSFSRQVCILAEKPSTFIHFMERKQSEMVSIKKNTFFSRCWEKSENIFFISLGCSRDDDDQVEMVCDELFFFHIVTKIACKN